MDKWIVVWISGLLCDVVDRDRGVDGVDLWMVVWSN